MEETQETQNPEETQEGEPQAEPQNPELIALQSENERKEGEIKRLQGILRKQGLSKDEINTLHQKIDDMQLWTATALDQVINKVSGEEEERPQRKTYRQQLEEKQKSKPPPQQNPDVDRFIGYLNSHGLTVEDNVVQEAVADDRTPQEALNYLKEKMETENQAGIDKKIQEGIRLGIEQALKDRGLTATGAAAPSGSSGRSFTQKQINDMSMEEYKEKYPDIQEAIRQGRIK